ncbi:hypothetical protein GN956_G8723 [Arapaima gigas]
MERLPFPWVGFTGGVHDEYFAQGYLLSPQAWEVVTKRARTDHRTPAEQDSQQHEEGAESLQERPQMVSLMMSWILHLTLQGVQHCEMTAIET